MVISNERGCPINHIWFLNQCPPQPYPLNVWYTKYDRHGPGGWLSMRLRMDAWERLEPVHVHFPQYNILQCCFSWSPFSLNYGQAAASWIPGNR
jgi:hypothetical protein